MPWLPPLLIIALLSLFAVIRYVLQQRYPVHLDALVNSVDALLPQTQCAQCGYPGCRPYAHAMVTQGVALDLCPPGGSEVHTALVTLLHTSNPTNTAPIEAAPLLAFVHENQCIGCGLCLAPCPVDAIIGAKGYLHTVTRDCTGCELCVPPCPVDCIEMIAVTKPSHIPERLTNPVPPANHDCISCALCEPVCPVDLPVQNLWQLTERNQLNQANAMGMLDCIECGLCNRSCPSQIALAQEFGLAKKTIRQMQQQQVQRDRRKQSFAAHTKRTNARAKSSQRDKRIRQPRSWQ